MGQPSRVIYLPPGVAAPAMTPAQPQPVMPSGVPFDRPFFEQMLPRAVAAYYQQAQCDQPVVELLTVDGTTHYVKGISGVADSWVALHTSSEDRKEPIQVFIPYQTIFRVEIHPCDASRRPLGFILDPVRPEPPLAVEAAPAEPAPIEAPAVSKPRQRRAPKPAS